MNFSIYFPTISASRLTSSPACLFNKVVSSPVCGMIDTLKLESSTKATVSEIPSIAMDPFFYNIF
jgi:hypothetical protein